MPALEGFYRFIDRSSTDRARYEERSASSAVKSAEEGSWWREEEERLYDVWASTFGSNPNIPASNPYFDYFFSGADVHISVEGGDQLPIYALGYQVQQEKTPVYGYASYTYDAMLRGTRIVSGMLSLVTSDQYALHKAISSSTQLRGQKFGAGQYGLNEIRNVKDEENLDRYWRKNFDSNLDPSQRHVFSVHPPFNILMKFGIQDVSFVDPIEPSERVGKIRASYGNVNKNPLWTDVNERLVERPTLDVRVLLENIEILSKSVQVDSSGQPILETYSFLARDERLILSDTSVY